MQAGSTIGKPKNIYKDKAGLIGDIDADIIGTEDKREGRLPIVSFGRFVTQAGMIWLTSQLLRLLIQQQSALLMKPMPILQMTCTLIIMLESREPTCDAPPRSV